MGRTKGSKNNKYYTVGSARKGLGRPVVIESLPYQGNKINTWLINTNVEISNNNIAENNNIDSPSNKVNSNDNKKKAHIKEQSFVNKIICKKLKKLCNDSVFDKIIFLMAKISQTMKMNI